MSKRFVGALIALMVTITLGACKKTEAENLAERRAQFMAQQRKKAIENYEHIVQKYPDSEFAARAQERLRELQGPQAQTKK